MGNIKWLSVFSSISVRDHSKRDFGWKKFSWMFSYIISEFEFRWIKSEVGFDLTDLGIKGITVFDWLDRDRLVIRFLLFWFLYGTKCKIQNSWKWLNIFLFLFKHFYKLHTVPNPKSSFSRIYLAEIYERPNKIHLQKYPQSPRHFDEKWSELTEWNSFHFYKVRINGLWSTTTVDIYL